MSEKLSFFAGEKALKIIRDQGLSPDMIKVITGAAGGPKWIVLSGLDRFIFSHWLKHRTERLYLLGSSIGAYRFAAAMRKNPEATIDRFLDDYIHQAYSEKPSPKDVTDKGVEIIENYLGNEGVSEVLTHPFLRLNIMVARCKGLGASEQKPLQIAGFLAALIGNLASRNTLRFFFERTLFYDQRDKAPFHTMNQFPIQRIALTCDNLQPAILASGAIPIVMSGITDIPGTDGGMFRDGGILDYHMDIPYGVKDGIVLFPHYTDQITPGWLDKHLKHRKPAKDHVDHLLMICPSRSFINTFPYAKIPDRNDFAMFNGNDQGRFEYWKTVAEKSRELADDFHDAVDSGRIRDLIKPLN